MNFDAYVLELVAGGGKKIIGAGPRAEFAQFLEDNHVDAYEIVRIVAEAQAMAEGYLYVRGLMEHGQLVVPIWYLHGPYQYLALERSN